MQISKTSLPKNVLYTGYSIHPKIDKYLEETYGILIYQETLMTLFAHVMGVSFAEADIARRAISKYKPGKKDTEKAFNDVKQNLKSGLEKLGLTRDEAEQVIENILKDANYSFNKSHSVSYAQITEQTIWWKYHYRNWFYAALLNNTIDLDKRQQVFEEIILDGIKIAPPNINKSGLEYTADEEYIYLPLTSIRGMADLSAMEIINNRPYKTCKEFMTKVALSRVSNNIRGIMYILGMFDGFEDKSLENLNLDGKSLIDLGTNTGSFEKAVNKFFPRGKKKHLLNSLYFYISEHDNGDGLFINWYKTLEKPVAKEIFNLIMPEEKFLGQDIAVHRLRACKRFTSDNHKQMYCYNFILPSKEFLQKLEKYHSNPAYEVGFVNYIDHSKLDKYGKQQTIILVNNLFLEIRSRTKGFENRQNIKKGDRVICKRLYHEASGRYVRYLTEYEVV